jgi:hypothetical protein
VRKPVGGARRRSLERIRKALKKLSVRCSERAAVQRAYLWARVTGGAGACVSRGDVQGRASPLLCGV